MDEATIRGAVCFCGAKVVAVAPYVTENEHVRAFAPPGLLEVRFACGRFDLYQPASCPVPRLNNVPVDGTC